MKDWDSTFITQLLAVNNYRDFIKLFFHRDSSIVRPKKLTFGEFAQRSTFASKAYLNDIIAGRKRLTPGAFDKVATGLRLNTQWSKYFKYLVSCEESKFHSLEKDHSYYATQLLKVKNQIQRQQSVQTIPEYQSKVHRILLSPDFSEIYASLGDLDVGETFESIAKKNRLSPNRLKVALAELEAIGVLHYDSATQRYIPLTVSLETYGLKDKDVFKNAFFHSLEKAKKRFPQQAPSNNSLFMTQTLSVKSSQLPALRQQLAEIIENFAIQAEEAEGDSILELCISMTHNH